MKQFMFGIVIGSVLTGMVTWANDPLRMFPELPSRFGGQSNQGIERQLERQNRILEQQNLNQMRQSLRPC